MQTKRGLSSAGSRRRSPVLLREHHRIPLSNNAHRLSLRARVLDGLHQRGVLPLHRLAAVLLERRGDISRGLVSLVDANDAFAALDALFDLPVHPFA